MCRKNLSYLVFLWKDTFKVLWFFFSFFLEHNWTDDLLRENSDNFNYAHCPATCKQCYSIVFVDVFTEETEKVKKKQRQDSLLGTVIFYLYSYYTKRTRFYRILTRWQFLSMLKPFGRTCTCSACCNTKSRRIIFCIYGAEATACIHCYAF